MANNKIIFGNQVLIDLTSDDISATALRKGITAHDASGEIITGTASVVYNPREESLNLPDWSVIIE